MSISRVFAAAAIAATFTVADAQAQSFKNGLVPAEFPPASYSGRQYVDSEGCVFIRAGIDGNVTWVPRVTRSRKIVCGFQPTFAKAAPAPAATAVATTKPKAKRKAAPRAPAPEPAGYVQPAPAPVEGQAACRGGTTVSQQYVGRVGQGVRCGPQQARFPTRVQRGQGGYAADTEPRRVVPRHVYENQKASATGSKLPKGYKPAWDDDRLNPYRAHQTLAGKAKMDQVWTETLPRKLLPRKARQAKVATTSGDYVSVGSTGSTLTLSTRSSARQQQGQKASDR